MIFAISYYKTPYPKIIPKAMPNIQQNVAIHLLKRSGPRIYLSIEKGLRLNSNLPVGGLRTGKLFGLSYPNPQTFFLASSSGTSSNERHTLP
jgi:hypothetical protein